MVLAWVGRTVNRSHLPNDDAVADDQPGILAVVFQMLWRQADVGGRANLALISNHSVAMEDTLFMNDSALTKGDAGLNDAKGPDDHIVRQLGAGIDKGGRMNLSHILRLQCKRTAARPQMNQPGIPIRWL